MDDLLRHIGEAMRDVMSASANKEPLGEEELQKLLMPLLGRIEDQVGQLSGAKLLELPRLIPACCVSLSEDDIESIGYDASKLSQSELRYIAGKVGGSESLMESWWAALESYCEDLPKLLPEED